MVKFVCPDCRKQTFEIRSDLRMADGGPLQAAMFSIPTASDDSCEKDMDIRIDEEKNIAYIKLSGQLSKKAILSAFDLTVSDKRYKKGMGRLWDFRDADLSSLDSATITKMAQYSLRFPPGINDVKVAFVVSRDLEYGLSRMFEISSEAQTPIHVFRAMDEAERWMVR